MKKRSRRRSIQSQLLWRSCLGSPAAWSGSGVNSRGIYLVNDEDINDDDYNDLRNNGKSRIREITSDKRMFHLPCPLRDVVLHNPRLSVHNYNIHNHSYLQLLPHPRIVGAILSSSSRRFSSITTGISCMDLDRGYDPINSSTATSPPRYLLVGSGGGDCSIALYDLSYFGSDQYLNQSQQKQQQQNGLQPKSTIASVTHRPIARSLRHSSNDNTTTTSATEISGVPNGHRQPILNVKWYPADICGSFVSASISGEILIWDAQNFVPVFATYTHVYSGLSSPSAFGTDSSSDDNNKSVAPLNCMDLPKSPDACPHGCALLALGLGGGDGRGVIQLCDAFRGGSATHELVGHTGGVNGVMWDPAHPFRLASAGEDCTVRLWDIRKAGASACLGVLDREKRMDENGDGASNKVVCMQPSSKKRRLGVRQQQYIKHVNQGVESHGVPVSSVTFTPSGDELISAGFDGKLLHWNLRPDSCFHNPEAALRNNLRQGTNGAGMDPNVSMSGRLYPTIFTRDSRSNANRQSFRRKRTVLTVTQTGSRDTAMLFASNTGTDCNNKISGYSLLDGAEQISLDGHLGDVTSIIPISPYWDDRRVGGGDDIRYDVKLLTSGKDGAVLSWGVPLCKSGSNVSDDNGNDCVGDGGDVMSILRRERQRRTQWSNCRNQGIRTREEGSLVQGQDIDTW
jgi:WD40 repeat protein